MTKELEALQLAKGLLKGTDIVEKGTGIKGCKVYATREIFEKIVIELERLNAIDNAEPSEALEFLKQQAIAFEHSELAIKVANGHYATIKQTLLKAEKLEQENKFLKNALNTLIKIDDSDLSHLKIKAIPQNVAVNQDIIKLLKEMLEND